MADPNKRLALLEQMVTSGQADAFAYYGLAMEYRRLGRFEESLTVFKKLREKDPGYLPMYLMVGQVLTELGLPEEKGEWLNAGIALARERGDMKTLGELEAALP
jgi:tetratricopeptide (TPR) repeat protein